MKILLDLDEVLADFVGAACTAWGTTRPAVERHWPAGVWDLVPPLGRALGQPLTPADFGARLRDRPDFWAGLAPLPWATPLLDWLTTEVGRPETVYLVTSPSLCPSSYAGKAQWVARSLGPHWLERLILTGRKELLAGYDRLLIDDREESVGRFRAAGGRGIVFPAHHNSLHAHRDDPLTYVKSQF